MSWALISTCRSLGQEVIVLGQLGGVKMAVSMAKLNTLYGLPWFNLSVMSKIKGACCGSVGCVKY